MSTTHETLSFQHYADGKLTPVSAPVIAEAAVALTVNGQPWIEFLCTPADLEALAVGFLFNENLIQTRADLASVHLCATGDQVDIWTQHPLVKPAVWRRTSGCGGGTTAQTTPSPAPTPEISEPVNGYAQIVKIFGDAAGFKVEPAVLTRLMHELVSAQTLYRQARGVHSAAVSDGETLFLQVEDIGRHNTLDKIAGHLLLEAPALPPRILLTTGRISSEMLQKTRRIGAQVIVSHTSPTTLSVKAADQAGITLVGYARNGQMNIYTHVERILINESGE